MPEFTTDWVGNKPQWWKQAIDASPFPIYRGLEIGAYEGRSALWFVENYFKDRGHLRTIDPHTNENVFDRFQENTEAERRTGRLVHVRQTSTQSLYLLLDAVVGTPKSEPDKERYCFDFAYIDGSHYCWDVLADLVLVFQILRVGAVIICDDYVYDTPRKNVPLWEYERPDYAIDAFERCMGPKLKIEPSHRQQRIFRKVSN